LMVSLPHRRRTFCRRWCRGSISNRCEVGKLGRLFEDRRQRFHKDCETEGDIPGCVFLSCERADWNQGQDCVRRQVISRSSISVIGLAVGRQTEGFSQSLRTGQNHCTEMLAIG
jgi:hypothetical protein